MAQDTIEIGDVIETVLTTGGEAKYQFTGEAGNFVRITLVSEDFDAYLRLEESLGNILIEDDDGAGNLNSRIGPYELPFSGVYTIVATSLSGRDTGNYTLSLTRPEFQRIEYTQQVTGELPTGESTLDYSFTAQAGDVVSISLSSDDFDSYLRLTREGVELTSNDDGGSNLNSRIGPYTLTETGEYIINVSAYDSKDGAFTLTLDRIRPIEIEIDQTSKAEISGSKGLYFRFEGSAGQLVDIRVDTGDNLDTYLTLIGPDSYEITSDDDSGGRVDPAVNSVMLTLDGTYYIAVQPNVIRDAVTALDVSLTSSLMASLDDGAQTLTFNDNLTDQYLMFEGEAGEQLTLRIVIDSDIPISPNITVTQAGTQIAYVSYYSVFGEVTFGLIVTDDGPVTVQFSDYSYASDEFTVTLER